MEGLEIMFLIWFVWIRLRNTCDIAQVKQTPSDANRRGFCVMRRHAGSTSQRDVVE